MKLRTKFTNIFQSKQFLLVVSLLVGAGLWLYIATVINDIVKEVYSDVPVNMELQTETLNKLGLKIVGSVDATVSAEVKAKRYIIGSLEKEEIVVTASVAKITGPGEYDLELEGLNENLEFASITPPTVRVRLDVFSSKRMDVETVVTGDTGLTVAEGYRLPKDPVVTPSEVVVTGPDALLSKIDRCVVRVPINEPLKKSRAITGQVILLDAAGNEIDQSDLTLDNPTVTVNISVLKVKNLDLTVKFINMPSNIRERDIPFEMTSKALEVAGPENTLNRYTELVVGYVDMKELEPGAQYVFDMSDIEIPSTFIYDQNIENVTVEFPLEGIGERYFNVENIQLINATKDYDITVTTKKISNVLVYGPEETLEAMTPGDLIAEVDLATRDIRPGQYTLGVNIHAPNKRSVWVNGEYEVIVNIKEK